MSQDWRFFFAVMPDVNLGMSLAKALRRGGISRCPGKAGPRLVNVDLLISNKYMSALAADVTHELLDDELLVGNDRFDDIADGNETNEFAVFHNGKMAGALLGHE